MSIPPHPGSDARPQHVKDQALVQFFVVSPLSGKWTARIIAVRWMCKIESVFIEYEAALDRSGG
jgi:hypothetical protein